MTKPPTPCAPAREHQNFRRRLWRTAPLALLLGAILATARPSPACIGQGSGASEPAGQDLKRALTAVHKVTDRPIPTLHSEHFQAVGDASESFMKITLGDCERIAQGYFDHFRAKGFDVRVPDRRLTLIVFVDERPFRTFNKGVPAWAWGLYKPTDNWLVLFDFRNATSQMLRQQGYQANMLNLAHEATHLLAYNTGLLNRKGNVPRAISEGIATYNEARKLDNASAPGQINSMRLDDLAHIQRRVRWIGVADLITDDKAAFGPTADRLLLAYAESWLLVYHLMTTPSRLPQFRDYLKSISKRTDGVHRLQDAEASFGSLDRLDRDVRQEGIRLQQRR
ncbi:MAG: DUF1570 domain-containing protein [Isosphaeraceae bacterium]